MGYYGGSGLYRLVIKLKNPTPVCLFSARICGSCPPGCSSMYEDIWPTIFEAIADGASLKSALRHLNPSPSYAWAKKTLRNDPELHAQYREAQQDRADRLAEQIIELADTPMPKGLEGKERSSWVQHLRVQIDARKWTAAKLYPRIYGERLDVSMTEARISITAALAEAERRIIDGQLLDQSVGLVEGSPTDKSLN